MLLWRTCNPLAAANLLLHGYRPNTRRSYMSKCRVFFAYCGAHQRAPLPASVATIFGYVVYELEGHVLAPLYLSKYMYVVASLHSLAGHADPTEHELLQLDLFGYRSQALERACGELTMQWMPVPTDYILRVFILGNSNINAYVLRQCGGLVQGYVLFNRLGAAACIRRCDLAFTANGMELQFIEFKIALRTGRERLVLTAQVDVEPGHPNRIAQLLRLDMAQHDSRGRHAAKMLFADPAVPAPA